MLIFHLKLCNCRYIGMLLILSMHLICQGFVIPVIHTEKVQSAVEHMFECRFDQALSAVDSISSDSMGVPLQWMLKLSIIGMRHLDYNDTSGSDLFEATYATTQSVIKKYEEQAGRTSLLLTAQGFSCCIAAAYRMHNKEYIEGIRLGFEALSCCQEAKKIDSANTDVDLILGLYSYARAELRRKFWGILFWYPGDKRTGIQALISAAHTGHFASLAAQAALQEIYIREENYTKASDGLNQLVCLYPRCRFLMWSRVKLYEAQKLYANSAEVYMQLADAYEIIPAAKRNYHETRFMEAQRYFLAGNFPMAQAACNKVLDACAQNPMDHCREAQKMLTKIPRSAH